MAAARFFCPEARTEKMLAEPERLGGILFPEPESTGFFMPVLPWVLQPVLQPILQRYIFGAAAKAEARNRAF